MGKLSGVNIKRCRLTDGSIWTQKRQDGGIYTTWRSVTFTPVTNDEGKTGRKVCQGWRQCEMPNKILVGKSGREYFEELGINSRTI
jgi:hypothetical protein